ncbi:hypothetical protein GYMLUDRAFT_784343 [Collybiopsis luxurians FD-317 M1]|nr:hypothetical protein GYMLUDRAFT_784343 [Collybiopsis luxurians FD-317 M1]
MPSVVSQISESKKSSEFSTSASQCSDSQKRIIEKPSSPQLQAPVRRSTTSLVGMTWDVSDQVLHTITGVAQCTSVPYMGTVAVIAYSIFNAVQGARNNQDTLKQLAYLACNTVQVVYDTFQELHGHPPSIQTSSGETQSGAEPFSSDPTLNAHLLELIQTLQDIDDWIKSLASRNILRRVISSRSDLNFIQDFKDRLKQAMDKFQLQSMIILRYSMSQIAAQQKAMEEEAVRVYFQLIFVFPSLRQFRSPPSHSFAS